MINLKEKKKILKEKFKEYLNQFDYSDNEKNLYLKYFENLDSITIENIENENDFFEKIFFETYLYHSEKELKQDIGPMRYRPVLAQYKNLFLKEYLY